MYSIYVQDTDIPSRPSMPCETRCCQGWSWACCPGHPATGGEGGWWKSRGAASSHLVIIIIIIIINMIIILTNPRHVEASERTQLGHVAQTQAGFVFDQGKSVAIREWRMHPPLRLHGDKQLSDIDIWMSLTLSGCLKSNHIPYMLSQGSGHQNQMLAVFPYLNNLNFIIFDNF